MNQKILNIFRLIWFSSFIIIFLSGNFLIKGSHPPTEKRSAYFIFCLDNNVQKGQVMPKKGPWKGLWEDLLNEIQRVLNLEGQYRDIVLGPEKTKDDIIAYIKQYPDKEPVIIAMGERASIVAEITQTLEKEGKRKIHTIILFDPTVAVKRRGKYYPIEFNYNSISNRIYNFYSEFEVAPSGYRKIKPALGMDSSGKPYLKAVNIKCLYNTPQCTYDALPFFNKEGLIWRRNTTFTNEFQFSFPWIPKAIELASNQFRINTDLLCVLFNQQCPHPAIPDKDLPFLFINRFTELKENNLEYLVSKTNNYIWESENLSTEKKEQIEKQLSEEAKYNADIQAKAPDLAIRKGIIKYITGGLIERWIIGPLRNWFNKEPAIKDNPHKGEVAQVRFGNDLCVEEKNYLKKRRPKVKTALESLFGEDALTGKEVPTIAVVCSGGGIRATLTILGFLRGLKKIGLLGAVTYICTLSGSTWAVGPWISSDLAIEDIQNRLIGRLKGGLVSKLNIPAMRDALLVKWSFEQPITLVDWYGVFLANMLLPSQHVYLSEQHKRIENGDLPFPIYTAIDTTDEKHWYEFTPYEVGGVWLGHYIQSWAFGRKFAYGFSQDQAPEQSFGLLMGIFGAAFAAKVGRIYNRMVIPGTWTDTILSRLLKDSERRMTYGEIFNFTYGVPKSPIKNQSYIQMLDAGEDFNLPYPPISGERQVNKISQRKADIIIFVDASEHPQLDDSTRPEKNSPVKYAKRYGLPFPSTCVFPPGGNYYPTLNVYEENGCPTVIYMPLVQDYGLINESKSNPAYADLMSTVVSFSLQNCFNNGTCDTYNFAYPSNVARGLSSLAEFNVRANERLILTAISRYIGIERKQEQQKLSKASRNSNLTVCSKDKDTISPSVILK